VCKAWLASKVLIQLFLAQWVQRVRPAQQALLAPPVHPALKDSRERLGQQARPGQRAPQVRKDCKVFRGRPVRKVRRARALTSREQSRQVLICQLSATRLEIYGLQPTPVTAGFGRLI
jgi:hypothetical protein